MSNLLKFIDQKKGGSRGSLYWNRAEVDGAPFRSTTTPPLFKEEEYESRTRREYDTYVGQFDLNNDDERTRYQEILDHICNGWYRMIQHETRFVESTASWKALLIWAEAYQVEIPQGPS